MKTKQEILDEYRKELRLLPQLTSKNQVKKCMARLFNLEVAIALNRAEESQKAKVENRNLIKEAK